MDSDEALRKIEQVVFAPDLISGHRYGIWWRRRRGNRTEVPADVKAMRRLERTAIEAVRKIVSEARYGL